MTSQEIIDSIRQWEAIRPDSKTLINYLGQGNCYSYDVPAYALSSQFLHVYPGIYNDQLYFFMIPANYDCEEYADDISKYTIGCPIGFNVGSDNRLTPAVAKARIRAWQNNYQQWVPQQVNGLDGIFEAFSIPTQDFEVEDVDVVVTLGLKADTSATGGFQADLIVTNVEGKQIVYDDFTSVVPPFSALPSQQEFYLLALANS